MSRRTSADSLATAVCVPQLERLAAAVLPASVWDYVSGGAAAEHTLRWNDDAWQRIRLAPRVLVDVSRLDTSVTVLQHALAHPVVVAPTANHSAYCGEGEVATRRAASATGTLAVMSTLGSTVLSEVGAAAAGPWWFQLYVQSERSYSEDLVHRAVAAGASAVVLTVDTPVLGARDRDRRHQSTGTVDGLTPPNLVGAPPTVTWSDDALPHQRIYNRHLDPSTSWTTLHWLIDVCPVPVLVKGVLRADDARRCVEAGASGVLVSNHGARNLDTVAPTAEALPGVVAAVDGRVPVLVDGGIRRGTDIAKALCLGATAVLVGRPVVWGLAVNGQEGARWVLDTLWAELAMAMALLGATSVADLTSDLLWPDRGA